MENDGSGLIFYCGRRPIFTLVEGPWPDTTQRARVSFNVHNDRMSLLNTSGDLGGMGRCKPPSRGPGQSPGGDAGGQAPEDHHITMQFLPVL